MITNHAPTPWGIEETATHIYVGPLRADRSGKIAEIIYTIPIFCLTFEASDRHRANASLVCDAVNGKVSAPITEQQVVAFLKDRALEIKEKFGADKYASVGVDVSLYTANMESPVTTRVSIGSGAMSVHCHGSTFAEAWAEAAPKTPEKQAELKRTEAARLLAEADALAPATT